MRKIRHKFISLTHALELLLVLGVLLLYLASTQQSLQYVVDKIIADRPITYTKLSGSLLQNVTIEGIRFNKQPLAQKAQISWDLWALLKGKLVIDELKLIQLNPQTLQRIIENNRTKPATHQSAPNMKLPDISLESVEISLLPYHFHEITLSQTLLRTQKLHLTSDSLDISQLHLNTRTNLGTLTLNAEVGDGIIHLTNLQINRLNLDKVQAFVATLPKGEKNSTIPFHLRSLQIDTFHIRALPFHLQKHPLKSVELKGKNLLTPLENPSLDISQLIINLEDEWGKLQTEGKIVSNRYHGELLLDTYNPDFLKQKVPFIDLEALKETKIKLDADTKRILATLTLHSTPIFRERFKEYRVWIDKLQSKITFTLKDRHLQAITDANISTPYAQTLLFKDTLTFDKKLTYKGTIHIPSVQHFPKITLPLLKDAVIRYEGNESNLSAHLKTSKLQLQYEMHRFKEADFKLTSNELNLSRYFTLPKALAPLRAKTEATMHLDFHHPKVAIQTAVSSNALDLNGTLTFDHGTHFIADAKLIPDSILTKIDKSIKFPALFPSKLSIDYHNQQLQLHNQNARLNTQFTYDFNTTTLGLGLALAHHTFDINGTRQTLRFQSHIYSLKELQQDLMTIYDFKSIPLDGEVEINSTISELTKHQSNIYSRWLVYEYTPNHFAFAEKIHLNLHGDSNQTVIDNYDLHAFIYDDDRHLFATKSSTINHSNHTLSLTSLWINDSLQTEGSYDLNNKTGKLHSTSPSFYYKGKEGEAHLAIDLTTILHPHATKVKGGLHFLDATISYQHNKVHRIEDPDIIIIQEQKKRESSAQNNSNNLTLDIVVDAKKPLLYHTHKAEITLKPDLKIWKLSQKPLELLGQIDLLKGHYTEKDRNFKLLPGALLFGGNPLNPYLEIHAQYRSEPYLISIDISGRLDAPQIHFSSDPYLSQSDILSILLFNTTSDSLLSQKSSSSNTAISFFGNTFAKEILSNFGINLDKLVISTNEEGGLGVEIGKKISKKVTLIYINDIVQSIKVIYQNSDHFETDLSISPESSGIEFIYKQEY